ncbi:MAG: hypothetical protein ACJ796_00775 [Gemmatimonadaceae bacterium]
MRVGRRHWRLVTAALAVMALAACGGSKSDAGITPPVIAKTCGSGGTLQLSTLHAATVACSAGTDLTLQGGGASYLIVPQFATGSVVSRTTAYNIGVVGGATSDLTATSGPLLSVAPTITGQIPPAGIRRHARQQAFDAFLMEQARAMVASGTWRSASRSITPGAGPARASVPDPGSVRQFQVLASQNGGAYTAVDARLAYVGDNILLYVDTLAPANGFTPAQLTAFGGLFDKTLFPIDTAAFGVPSDVDQNGHVIMLLSPVVNSLTPSSSCESDGFIAGFFASGDLSASSSNSNHGEVFYGLVPDPSGTASCSHSVAELIEDTPTFLHEFQHMISFSQHVVLHSGPPERTFLDEGLSTVAEELGSLYYEDRFPPPTGRTNPAQLFPDSAEGFINDPLVDSYEYLLNTPVTSATLHPAIGAGVENYGADWLLVRYIGDQKGQAIFKKLEQSNLTGTANIANAAGEPFESLFGDFSLALYTDSLPGIAKSAIPPRNKYARRNLRQMYQRLYDTSQPSSFFPRPFPIVVRPLSGTISASMLPGTMTFYRLDTATGQGDVTVRFEASPGVALNDLLQPQLSIFRLPPGT